MFLKDFVDVLQSEAKIVASQDLILDLRFRFVCKENSLFNKLDYIEEGVS